MNEITTGNTICDQMMQINIFGNMIPPTWYKTVTKESTGKPYAYAILILADIVYWYRPREIRDEQSGMLIGFQKRFAADLLQRSYQQIADQIGITKRDATNAVVALEHLGVIHRIFRTITVNGTLMNNVLFLDLNVEILKKLTFPDTKKQNSSQISPLTQIGDRGMDLPPLTQIGDRGHSNRRHPLTQIGETNTEITNTEITTDLSIRAREDDGLIDRRQQQIMDSVFADLNPETEPAQSLPEPETVPEDSPSEVVDFIRLSSEPDLVEKILPSNPTNADKAVANLIAVLIPSMLKSKQAQQTIQGRVKTSADFYAWLSASLHDYAVWAATHTVRNPKAYLASVLANTLETYQLTSPAMQISTGSTDRRYGASYDLDAFEQQLICESDILSK